MPGQCANPGILEQCRQYAAGAKPESCDETQYDFFLFVVRDPVLNAFALPGSFIGVHSASILTVQAESNWASVLARENGHVVQRYIARMLGSHKQDFLISLAAQIVGALDAAATPYAGIRIMMGAQGLAILIKMAAHQTDEALDKGGGA